MNPHTHQWGTIYIHETPDGEVEFLRTCDYCGIEQRRNDTFRSTTESDLCDADPTISYKGPTEEFVTNKGSKLTKEAVVSANPGLTEKDKEELDRLLMLRSIGAVTTSTSAIADGIRKMSEVLKNESAGWTTFPETPLWTSDDALQLILREIRKNPASAGEWITRFTNGVIEITREEEGDAG